MDILRFALPSCRGTDLRPIGGGKGHGLTGLGTLTMGSDDEKGRGAECPVDESPSMMSPQHAGPRCGCDAMRTNLPEAKSGPEAGKNWLHCGEGGRATSRQGSGRGGAPHAFTKGKHRQAGARFSSSRAESGLTVSLSWDLNPTSGEPIFCARVSLTRLWRLLSFQSPSRRWIQ